MSRGALDNDCWHGLYRTTLALELENDIQEFELTMRGLLDVRAELHCGVFFAKSLDGLRVGRSHHQVVRALHGHHVDLVSLVEVDPLRRTHALIVPPVAEPPGHL